MFRMAIYQLWDAAAKFWAWLQKNPWPVFLLAAGLLGFLWVLIQTIRLDNMGLRGRSFWDWMELLIVPVALAAGVWWLNREGRKTERKIALDRQHQGTLEEYFDRMTELLLEQGLGTSEQTEEGDSQGGGKQSDLAASIARAQTLAVLRTLDPARVSAVFRFLLETKVGEKSLAEIVPLAAGNLRGVEWTGPEADLMFADLSGADLFKANLFRADLRAANLSEAYLLGADLSGADMLGANLSGADLSKANLKGARVVTGRLLEARPLTGATMPDGAKYEEWIKRQESEKAESNEEEA